MISTTTPDEARKKRLLAACQAIVDSSKGCKKILKETPICNIRQINREAKNIKDPNPLQTMMNSINEKFPISVNTKRAREVMLPEEMLGPKDVHRYGRRLCKLEAIKFFLDNSPLPSAEVVTGIDILYGPKREEVEEYYSYNWEKSRLIIGDAVMERRVINTSRPNVDIPRGQRNTYLVAALFPENLVNWRGIDTGLVQEIRRWRDVTAGAKVAIVRQIRLLTLMLDPKPRMIPICPSLPPATFPIRHSFASPFHRIEVDKDLEKTSHNWNDPAEVLGRCLAQLIHDNVRPAILRECMKTTKIGLYDAATIASNATKADIYTNVLRAVCGIAVISVKEIKGANFFPQSAVSQSRKRTTEGNVTFYSYEAAETVIVSYNDFTGSFDHIGERVSQITLQKMPSKMVSLFLARIAVYVKWNWRKSKGGSIKKIADAVFQQVMERPWDFLDALKKGVTMDLYLLNVSQSLPVGVLNFMEEATAVTTRSFPARIEGYCLVFEAGGVIEIGVPRTWPILPESARVYNNEMMDFLPPDQRLKAKIEYYTIESVYQDLTRQIRQYNYEWKNQSISCGVTGISKDRIHATSRALLLGAITDPERYPRVIVALFYCFSSNTNLVLTPDQYMREFQWFGSLRISFAMGEGLVTWFPGRLLVRERQVGTLTREALHPSHSLNFFKGWRLIPPPQDTTIAPLQPACHFLDQRIRAGTKASLYIYGNTYYFIKDPDSSYQIRETIKRQVNLMKAVAQPTLNVSSQFLASSSKGPCREGADDGSDEDLEFDSDDSDSI